MLDRDAVGATSDPVTRSWTSDDALLYALGIGAGGDQPELVTENSEGVRQRLFPTYAALLAGGGKPLRSRLGDWPAHAVVHGAQRIELPGPLPVAGTAEVVSTVSRIADKGTGALLEIEATGRRPQSGQALFTALTTLFLRGQGWGEPEHANEPEPVPDRAPDFVAEAATTSEQALIYRLSGDRNPLHSDPAFAARAGFPRPILHGLCTWGIVARVLLRELARGGESDPLARLASFSGRFRAPVLPGQKLTVRGWRIDERTWAHTASVDELTVIDRGELSLHAEEGDG
jgi:acyl dehydratase